MVQGVKIIETLDCTFYDLFLLIILPPPPYLNIFLHLGAKWQTADSSTFARKLDLVAVHK